VRRAIIDSSCDRIWIAQLFLSDFGPIAQFPPEADPPLAGASQKPMYTVYFLESIKNGKVYVGMTSKTVEERLHEHNNGCNKWTRENGPHKILFYETFHCKQDAVQRERFYKTGFGRKIKNILVEGIKNLGP
jgi:putative endonuclease